MKKWPLLPNKLPTLSEANCTGHGRPSQCFFKNLPDLMKHQNRLTTSSQAQETTLSGQETQQKQGSLEFASAEEMLRHDALHTPVPPAIAYRLQESISRTAPSSPSWWRKCFRSK